jgi:hypothetical protein
MLNQAFVHLGSARTAITTYGQLRVATGAQLAFRTAEVDDAN